MESSRARASGGWARRIMSEVGGDAGATNLLDMDASRSCRSDSGGAGSAKNGFGGLQEITNLKMPIAQFAMRFCFPNITVC